MNIISAAAWFQ